MVLILISIVVIVRHYPDKRDDQRAAGQFLSANARSTDAIMDSGLTTTLSLYFPDINKYCADNRSVQDLSGAQNVSRILNVDSQFNYTRTGLDDLFAAMPRPEEIRFRGITIYSFSKPQKM